MLLSELEKDVAPPLDVTLTLPPPQYARKGGEVVAAMLAKVGVVAKIENVEWAQWLSGVYKDKAYDLTVIAHVEPLAAAGGGQLLGRAIAAQFPGHPFAQHGLDGLA